MAKQTTRASSGKAGGTARRPARGAAAAGPSPKARMVVWSGLFLVGMVIISLPTVMLVSIGMLPTLVAWICDRSEEKFATFCVGGLNFSGVFPYVMDLWSGEHSVAAASATLTNVFALAVMFGCAALGWMLFAAVPPVVATFLSVLSERRLTTLRTQQRKLVEEWGDEVRGEVEAAQPAAPHTAAAPAAPAVPAARTGNAAA